MSFFTKHKITSLLIINIFLFIIVFLILEVAARFLFPQESPLGNETRKFWQYDSVLGWSHVPLAEDVQTISGNSVEIKINSKKLRSDEYSYSRKTKLRILVLGDSYAWGFGVNKNKRFSEIIEVKNKNIEIINAAVAGYSTDQQLLYYIHEGYKYNPDYVLLLFCENDFIGNTLNQIHWNNKPFFVVENNSLVLKGVPVPEQSSYQKFRKYISGASHFISFLLKRLTILNVQSYSTKDFSLSDAAIITGKIIERLNDVCCENNIRLLLVSIPMPKEKIFLLSNIAKNNSLSFLDLSPSFKYKNDFILPNDGHWNSKGHAITAEAILQWLEQFKITNE
jgi:lysophospholipase L1-like esterase